jgi:hypothetical protein
VNTPERRVTRADLIEAGWLPPGQLEREIRRRLLGGEPVCGLGHAQATKVGLVLAQAGISYPSISRVMALWFGPSHHYSDITWRHRLRKAGAAPRRIRGVPFPRENATETRL